VSNDEIKDQSPHQAMEDAGVGFDPSVQYLDLTKDEKRRTTALMLSINAYRDLIIKDAEYLRVASDLARRDEGPKIRPATMNAMVLGAIQFDAFIAGRYDHIENRVVGSGAQDAASDDAEVAP